MKKILSFILITFFTLTAFAEKNRIVCLNPAGYEILYMLGAKDKIAARTDFCDFPEVPSSIPSIGGFDGKTFSVESILACKPDFVYGSKGMHDYLQPVLKKYNIDLYLSDAQSIEDIKKEFLYIGELTGRQRSAKSFVSTIDQTLTNIIKKPPVPQKIYYEVWNNPYISIGHNSYINDIITSCGAKNIFDDTEIPYPNVSPESIIKANPDVILIQSDLKLSVEDIKKRPGWKNIKAVKKGRIYIINSDVYNRPGPRVLTALINLNKILWQIQSN